MNIQPVVTDMNNPTTHLTTDVAWALKNRREFDYERASFDILRAAAEHILCDSDYDEQIQHGFANWNSDGSKNDEFIWFSETGWGVCFNVDGSYRITRKD